MPAPALTVDRYLAALVAAGQRFLDDARIAGLDAPVPTCPAWKMRALVAHQAMVHRFATAVVNGTDPSKEPKQTALKQRDDLIEFFEEGIAELVSALRAAPDDLDVMTFLHDPPAPRVFWCRRQTHETTMHGVDALAGRLGRVPDAGEATIDDELALDGIDEILGGFYTRGTSGLFDGTPFDLLVAPNGSDRRWIFHVATKNTITRTTADHGIDAAATIRGTPVEIYLGLWNRGEAFSVEGDEALLARWREVHRITWN